MSFTFRHGRIYLVEKSWNVGGYEGERATKLVFATNARDMADTYVVNGNAACAKCPERTANKTKYRVLDRAVPARYRYEETEKQ